MLTNRAFKYEEKYLEEGRLSLGKLEIEKSVQDLSTDFYLRLHKSLSCWPENV